MTSLTKEELRQALISHGVTDLPPASAKKDELVSLYEEYVAPTANGSADFSSDDEVDFKSSPSKRASNASRVSKVSNVSKASKVSKSGSKSPHKKAEAGDSLLVEELDIDALDDDELFQKLKENDIAVGPIVASTRAFYKKKLAMVLSGESMNGTNGNGVEFSDTEEEDVETEPEVEEEPVIETRTTRRSASSKSTSQSPQATSSKSPVSSILSNISGLRQRQAAADEADTSGKLTPTPRRSIHSYKVSETTRTTIMRNRDGTETKNVVHKVERSEDNKTGGGQKSWSRTVVNIIKVLLLIAILVGVYFAVITQMESSGSMSQIDEIVDAVNKAQESAAPPPAREDVEAGSIGNV